MTGCKQAGGRCSCPGPSGADEVTPARSGLSTSLNSQGPSGPWSSLGSLPPGDLFFFFSHVTFFYWLSAIWDLCPPRREFHRAIQCCSDQITRLASHCCDLQSMPRPGEETRSSWSVAHSCSPHFPHFSRGFPQGRHALASLPESQAFHASWHSVQVRRTHTTSKKSLGDWTSLGSGFCGGTGGGLIFMCVFVVAVFCFCFFTDAALYLRERPEKLQLRQTPCGHLLGLTADRELVCPPVPSKQRQGCLDSNLFHTSRELL